MTTERSPNPATNGHIESKPSPGPLLPSHELNGAATSMSKHLPSLTTQEVKSPPVNAPRTPVSAGLSAPSISRTPTTPTIVVHSAAPPTQYKSDAQRPATARAHQESNSVLRLTTPIPTGSLDDLLSPERMQFSNRGSIIMEGSWDRIRRLGDTASGTSSKRSSRIQNGTAAKADASQRSTRMLSADEASLSAKVRSLYEFGGEDGLLAEQTLVEEEEDEATELNHTTMSPGELSPRSFKSGTSQDHYQKHLQLRTSPSRLSTRTESGIQRTPYETAGGIEDWEDIKGDEIDRYGFIMARNTGSRGSHTSGGTFDGVGVQRVTTSLLEASNTPRKRNTMLRRMPSRASARSQAGDGPPSRQTSKRSQLTNNSVYAHRNTKSISNSQASLKSHFSSKERRLVIDAGDMLTLPPRLAGLAEGDQVPITKAMREKEWERESKWKKMGRLRPGSKGAGMQFDFDVKDPKVIARTWKGIPDRWRAQAWYSFLEASARNNKESAPDDELVSIFYDLQHENSADDVQIDCDVPRTINRHIMFRRRYRGGQRLLFRVLHALSLYFPDVGYVQGMATLAATFLCYYDEEHAFVMMVRLWQLRGLERLYQSGFEGLMDALSEFEKNWLSNGQVAQKLVSDHAVVRMISKLTRRRRKLASIQPHTAQGGT